MADLGQQLRERLKGRVCVMGLGNVDLGDDGFGVRLAEALLRSGVSLIRPYYPHAVLRGLLNLIADFMHLIIMITIWNL